MIVHFWVNYFDTEIRLYLGGLEFKGGLAESYNLADGRLIFKGEVVKFQYNIKDHLGNSVVLFEDKNEDGLLTTEAAAIGNDDLEVLQRNFYYAFGMSMEGEWQAVAATPEERYLYNGKEKLEGIGLYDYGARMYDPVIGRWTSVDPLAGKYYSYSPYNYVLGNPISLIDPDGRSVDGIIVTANGKNIGSDGINDKKVYVVNKDLSKKEIRKLKKFVKKNNGNKEAFEADFDYGNVTEIEGAESTRQGMIDVVSKDDGKGGAQG